MAFPTKERLREVFSYDAEKGNLVWRIRTSNRVHVGRIAGCLAPNGYFYASVDGHRDLLHRFMWAYFNGKPASMIDHVDCDRLNNRIENLRQVDYRVNAENKRYALPSSKTGVLGVSICKRDGRYKAQIQVRGKNRLIGRFRTLEEAKAAYIAAKRMEHEGCTL